MSGKLLPKLYGWVEHGGSKTAEMHAHRADCTDFQ